MLLRIIILLSIFISSFSYASNTTLDAIIINADDVVIDKKTSSSIFTGHVILWFDNGIIIETDKVIVTTKEENGKKSINKITMPSKVRAIRNGENVGNILSAITLIAECAEYTEEISELRLKGYVYIQDNDNFVKCDELIYYAKPVTRELVESERQSEE